VPQSAFLEVPPKKSTRWLTWAALEGNLEK